MAEVTFVEKFPKLTVSKASVEAERDFKSKLAGTKSCVISDDDSNWILTTVIDGENDKAPS
jgi:hypothetical protein